MSEPDVDPVKAFWAGVIITIGVVVIVASAYMAGYEYGSRHKPQMEMIRD